MSKADVRARLGAPERIGVLRGKDIERVPPSAEKGVTGRLVYFYRGGQLAVWFEHGTVSGVTCNAATAAGAADRSEDH